MLYVLRVNYIFLLPNLLVDISRKMLNQNVPETYRRNLCLIRCFQGKKCLQDNRFTKIPVFFCRLDYVEGYLVIFYDISNCRFTSLCYQIFIFRSIKGWNSPWSWWRKKWRLAKSRHDILSYRSILEPVTFSFEVIFPLFLVVGIYSQGHWREDKWGATPLLVERTA